MNSKKLRLPITILPFAFAIHNLEEVWAMANLEFPMSSPLETSVNQFTIATTLFSILGFILVFARKLYKTEIQYYSLMIGFAGMLFLNSFFPHISVGIIGQTYTPGLMSAIVLILPLSGYILWKSYKLQLLFVKRFFSSVICGGIVGLLLVLLFLGIGYILTEIVSN